jgi:hypothetical protein
MRVATVLITTLAFGLLAGCGGDDGDDPTVPSELPEQASEIAGQWTGLLSQTGLPDFRVAALIDENGKGAVAYTGIRCAGRWTLDVVLLSDPAMYRFTEVIDEGAGGQCKGRGTVQLMPRSTGPVDELAYRFRGGGVASVGVLMRASDAELDAVLEQAGLQTLPAIAPSPQG